MISRQRRDREEDADAGKGGEAWFPRLAPWVEEAEGWALHRSLTVAALFLVRLGDDETRCVV
jgi:hypothetical protein